MAMSASDPIKLLAAAAGTSGRFEMRSVSVGGEGNLAVESPAPPSRYHFTFAGTQFNVRLNPRVGGFHMRLFGLLGHIPFTVEGREMRLAALEILRSAVGLDKVAFTISHGQQVMAVSDTDVAEPALPEVVLHETALILHQARPFMALLKSVLVSRSMPAP